MSERQGVRLRVHEDGSLTVVDPDPSVIPLLRELDPMFSVRVEMLQGFTQPRILKTATTGTGLARSSLAFIETNLLWRAHRAALDAGIPRVPDEASLLDLKIELSLRMLRHCELCGLRCGVNREAGQLGRCGLGTEALVYESYVHIAEEPPINPSLNISLRGCGLRCRFCQQSAALSPRGDAADRLDASTWGRLDLSGARSLSFVGGNPTESLPAILRFLASVPADFCLPVVWNCAGYESVEAVRLLDGVCDAYVPDCKYGSNACAEALSQAPNYPAIMRAAIGEMCRHGVPVFVRMLILPGHEACCHLPSLALLSTHRDQVTLNILSQYMPDFLIRPGDGALARRVKPGEVAAVRAAAIRAGFRLLDFKPQGNCIGVS